jgi:hypothetical protein
MRKRYLIIIAVLVVSIFSIIYYLSLPTTFPNVFNEPQNQGNETPAPFGFHIRFPWQATQTTPNQSSGGGSEGGGGAGAGGTGGGAGTGGTGEETSTYIQKNHASIDSIPEGLKIFVSYYNNGIKSSLASYAPFSLETDPDSPVCMLLASMIGNNTLKWTIDGQDCQFSVCEEFSYNRTETLYSDYGCLINMNEDHSVTLHFIPS